MYRKSTVIVSIVVACVMSLSVGRLIGRMDVEDTIIREVDSWHTARFYEDGSWVVNYKDGTGQVGCIETGLCQD